MNLKLQLKVLSFLQFCLWGSWLTTLGSYMFVTLKFDGAAIGAVYSSLGIAAVFMPTLLGIVADKWISAKWVYAICHLVGALTLWLAAQSPRRARCSSSSCSTRWPICQRWG